MSLRVAPTEEIANAASHGLGFLIALAAWPLLATAPHMQPPAQQAGMQLFALTMLLMFGSSALYHAMPEGALRQCLRRLDHSAIFLFIAGSSTPFAIGRAEHPGQLTLVALIWAFAIAGTLLKLADRLNQPLASTMLYLAFGWLAAAAVLPVLPQFTSASLHWLLAGGLAYSIGCAFYLAGRHVRYGHLVWHLLVIVGSTCHLFALLRSDG